MMAFVDGVFVFYNTLSVFVLKNNETWIIALVFGGDIFDWLLFIL